MRLVLGEGDLFPETLVTRSRWPRLVAHTFVPLFLVLLAALAEPKAAAAQREAPGCTNCGGSFTITPDGGYANTPANSTGQTVWFSAYNGTTSTKTVNFSCSTTGPVTCTGIDLPSYTFDVGETIDITATYSTGSVGTGTLTLAGSGGASDQGDYTIDVTGPPPPPPAPIVNLRNLNDDNLDRSLCLTSGAGEAAAWQCGDLQVAHSTPAYATMGRERSLTLVYNSATAAPHPVAVAAVTQPGTGTPPTSVYAELKVNTGSGYVVVASATYGAWTSGTRQIALAWNAYSYNGRYAYTLEVRNQAASGSTATVVNGYFLVRNRNQTFTSQVGNGWNLAGLEQIWGLPDNTMIWTGGDGSVKLYRLAPGYTWGKWVGPAGGYRDTLTWNATAAQYIRTLRHGIEVRYDANGLHRETVGRTGQRTQFFWNPTTFLLDSIRVPPVSATTGTTYKLVYSGGYLDYIRDPAGRVTDVTITSGQLTSIVDPDTSVATTFAYDGANRMISRSSRRGHTTSFKYDNDLHVTRVIVPGTLAAGDTTVFQSWDEKGLGSAAGGPIAVDTANVFTKILGPRMGVADDATFWVDRWGAPVKIVNPLGQTTTLVRGDAVVPALVTQVTFPDGRIGLMTYNSRGNLTQSKDSSGHLPNGLPSSVTKWSYNSPNTFDSPDSIVDPEGVTTRYRYNGWGLDSLVISPNGHQTRFDYKPAGSPDSLYGLVRAVVELGVPSWDSVSNSETTLAALTTKFGFNSLGNVVADTSPLGRVRTYTRDTRQLVTTALDAGGYRSDFTYDNLNRLTRKILHGELAGSPASLFPADSGISKPDTTRWTYTVDVLTSVRDPRGVTRTYGYDRLGRKVTETDDYGVVDSTFLNALGAVDSVRDRTGRKVRHTYDAGGRLLKTRWETRNIIVGDSVVYTYDSGNRILKAQRFNPGRTSTRTYYGNGLLKTEQQSGLSLFRNAYTYDKAGKRLTYVLGRPASTQFNDSVAYRYDVATGNLARIFVRWRHPAGNTDPFTQDSVRFAWDAMGRRDTVAFPAVGLLVRFAYDADGNSRVICGVHTPQNPVPNDYVFHGGVFHQWVDANGRVRKSTRIIPGTMCGPAPFNGDNFTNTYDMQAQLLSQIDVSGWKFRYDRSGNMIKREKTNGTDNNVFTIDPGHNRLTRQDRNGSLWMKVSYDPDGARMQECPVVNAQNQCVTGSGVGGGYREYYYDGLSRTAGTLDYVCNSFSDTYVCASLGTYGVQNCGYEAMGRLDRACESAAPQLGYDGQNVVSTVNDSTGFGWTFVHGPGTDDPVLAYSPWASTQAYAYFITDGNGRQFGVGDRLGVSYLGGGAAPSLRQNHYQQDGGRYSGAASTATTFGANRFNGAAHSGLTNFRNRFYDQRTGSWTQEDPIGLAGGVNLYQFNGNNPVAYTDPFGLCPEIPQLCVAGAVAVGKAVLAAARSPTGQRVIQGGSELARNLAQSGAVRQAGQAVHHIVAKAAQAAQPARDKLAEVGIKINDAVNGVILPAMKDYAGQAVNHLGVHTQRYYNAVNEALANVQVKEEAVAVLNSIGEALKNGTFPH